MADRIRLRKGLNLHLKGQAERRLDDVPVKGIYAVCPDDFYGLKPKVTVKEGDHVLAGDVLFVSKADERLKVVSPVSGSVVAVVRGDRRKLLRVCVEADAAQQGRNFGRLDLDGCGAQEVKDLLLESGLFAYFRQRPYDIVANPEDTPKAIFVSAFSTMPLAADFNYVLLGREDDFREGLKALSRLATVHLGISPEQEVSLGGMPHVVTTVFDGPNPAGNVGVQISHVSPVNKGEVVWTLGAEEVIFVGHLMHTGQVDLTRVVALAGSRVKAPSYYKTQSGVAIASLTSDLLMNVGHTRLINGNPLVGKVVAADGFLSAHATEVCAIPEGDDQDEVLGWIMPRLAQFSTRRSYFSWLQGRREYDLDARIKGGERHIIMSGEYDKVLPMDILGEYLIKAILTGDLDRMEQLGLLEVAPEDFAVAEFVDSSKLELQRIVREGLDLYRKEMA
ncbi:MAG: Na(+)-translocating NADH-quinone reductase subunit A [Bacteroidaceae bacterium]|nr:Na(+)-translocating NADH-quinone reductase subunit A [Bacteroidaceae bacterium]